MTTTSEKQIWEAAIMLVRRHGEDAAAVADREAAKYDGEGEGDEELNHIVWSWIARVTAELIKPEPDAGERVH